MGLLAFVFLGNPGMEYEKTRHNVGWMVAEKLASRLSANEWTKKFNGDLCSVAKGVDKLLLFKPLTFVNLSGNPTRQLCDFYKIGPESLVVVHDELELSFGKIAFRWGGGASGHNGLRSLDTILGKSDYRRCRVGVGRPKHGDVASFVLSRFNTDEEIVLDLILDAVCDELLNIIDGKKHAAQFVKEVCAP